jgi:hypothetical protein
MLSMGPSETGCYNAALVAVRVKFGKVEIHD